MDVIKELVSLCDEKKVVNKQDVLSLIDECIKVLFPYYFEEIDIDLSGYIERSIKNIKFKLKYLEVDEEIIEKFINNLPNIKKSLIIDLDLFLKSDPAVVNKEEIILSYPGFYAIMLYRISNSLVDLEVEVLPRIISEYAHFKTGIDIHPNAKIKDGFFIDHGTGVVIGATSIVGSNVKIYQGVVLGALSLENIDEIKNIKRHPTIEDNVTIFCRASILGGQTVIGKNCIIGSNTFITKSIVENSKVVYTNFGQLHKIKELV